MSSIYTLNFHLGICSCKKFQNLLYNNVVDRNCKKKTIGYFNCELKQKGFVIHKAMMKMMQCKLIFTRRCQIIPRSFCSSSHNREASVSLVQGASRGIGLEFVKQLLVRDQKGHVLATCRNPDQSTGLQELKSQYSDRLNLLKVDVTDENTIEAAATSVGETFGYLNLLLNTSGILSIPNMLQPETTLAKVQKPALLLAYEVNAVGPLLMMKHMWPLLKLGGKIGTTKDAAVVANLSARVGSIGDNNLGGWHSYRASKTALNQLTKTASVEFARKKDPIICLLLHPGTVDTDLSQPFQRNVPKDKLFTKEFSVNKLLSIIDAAKIHDNGKFFAWDGQEIPW